MCPVIVSRSNLSFCHVETLKLACTNKDHDVNLPAGGANKNSCIGGNDPIKNVVWHPYLFKIYIFVYIYRAINTFEVFLILHVFLKIKIIYISKFVTCLYIFV